MFSRAIILITLLWGLIGCQSAKIPDQVASENDTPLKIDNSLGQTFVARYNGLNAITLRITQTSDSDGILRLHIRESPQSANDLRIVELPLNRINTVGDYEIKFQTIKYTNGDTYFFILSLISDSSLRLGIAPPENYLDGAMYVNAMPVDAQLLFSLSYDPLLAFLGLIGELITWGKYLLAGVILFILPGLALLTLALPKKIDLVWIEKIALASGLGFVIYPIAYLWSSIVGLKSGPIFAWVLPGLSLVVFILRLVRVKPKDLLAELKTGVRKSITIDNLVLFFLLVLLAFSRFWSVRSIPIPLWGDSYQHSLIAQLLVDNRGLFQSWQPYTDLTSFSYHFGLHTLVAGFHYLTRLSIPQSLLWFGQILNILAVISIVPLALRIQRSSWSVLLSILLVGFLFDMPMFYTNWGRYTQLTGQVILALVIWIAWHTFEADHMDWKAIFLSWLALGGLALTHYRVLVFAIAGILAVGLFQLRKGLAIRLSVKALLMAAGAFSLYSPWLINLFAGKIPTILIANINVTAALTSNPAQLSEPIGKLTSYLPALAWIFIPLAIFWGIWKRQRGVAVITLWMTLVYLSANPHLLRLPGTHLITNFAIFIAAYIPAGILLAGVFAWLIDLGSGKIGKLMKMQPSIPAASAFKIIIAVIIVVLALWGFNRRLSDLDPSSFALASVPDLQAAEWIKTNTPAEAKFLINSFPFNTYGDIAGSDGGWWLPVLTKRQTTLPPQNVLSEQGVTPDFREQVNYLTEQIQSQGINSPEVMRSLKERGITHVYVGQKRGSVNSPVELLPPAELLQNPNFQPVYHQDLVWIFEIRE